MTADLKGGRSGKLRVLGFGLAGSLLVGAVAYSMGRAEVESDGQADSSATSTTLTAQSSVDTTFPIGIEAAEASWAEEVAPLNMPNLELQLFSSYLLAWASLNHELTFDLMKSRVFEGFRSANTTVDESSIALYLSATLKYLTPELFGGVEDVCGPVFDILVDGQDETGVDCLWSYYETRRSSFDEAMRIPTSTAVERLTDAEVVELRHEQERRFFEDLGEVSLPFEDIPQSRREEGLFWRTWEMLSAGYLLASPETIGAEREAFLMDKADSEGAAFSARLDKASNELDPTLSDGVRQTCILNDPREYLRSEVGWDESSASDPIDDLTDDCILTFVMRIHLNRVIAAQSG